MTYDPTAIVQTIGLTKRYGSYRGITEVDLALYGGEAYGFLGPNGAGKTTTIRCILDLLRPTAGASYLFGERVQGSTAHLRGYVGYVAGEERLLANYTGEDHVRLAEGLRGSKAPHVAELANRLEIDLRKKVRTLSKGNKQKVALLLAFMFDSGLYILDEPTSGLDPLNQQLVFQIIKERRNSGASILLSSHILSEVEHSCSRVGIISAGRLLAEDTMESLLCKQSRQVRVLFAPGQELDWSALAALEGLKSAGWEHERLFWASLHPQYLDGLMRAVSRFHIEDIEIQKASLEEVFMDFYSINQADESSAAEQIATLEATGEGETASPATPEMPATSEALATPEVPATPEAPADPSPSLEEGGRS